MKTIKAKIKIITPMCSYGNNNTNLGPEFRIPELKSLMRSTFREIYSFYDLQDMKQKEKELFGDIKNKSPIALKIECNELISDDEKIIPHKPKFKKKCLSRGNQLKINMMGDDDTKLEMYIILLIQSSIIGSLGNRSRKGFGSFVVTNIEGFEMDKYNELLPGSPKEIFRRMIKNSYKYKMNNYSITCQEEQGILEVNNSFKVGNFPYANKISIIKINRNYNEIIENISKLTHERLNSIDKWFINKMDRKKINENILGKCKYQKNINRFASPVYVSFWENSKDKYMIVKELNYNYIFNKLEIQEKDKEVNEKYVNEFVNLVKQKSR